VSYPVLDALSESRIYERGVETVSRWLYQTVDVPTPLLDLRRNMTNATTSSKNVSNIWRYPTIPKTQILFVSDAIFCCLLTIIVDCIGQRATHDGHVTIAHDETSKDRSASVEGLSNANG
jgi:hypothetical protein